MKSRNTIDGWGIVGKIDVHAEKTIPRPPIAVRLQRCTREKQNGCCHIVAPLRRYAGFEYDAGECVEPFFYLNYLGPQSSTYIICQIERNHNVFDIVFV